MQIKRWAKKKNLEILPMSLYTIRNESECRWPKNCPWIIDEYFRTNLRYLKLFFSEYVVWPFGMIPICLSSEPGGMWPTIYTWNEKREMDERFAHNKKILISIKENEKGRNESFSIKKKLWVGGYLCWDVSKCMWITFA
jgi:hypothetical protein